MHEFAEVLKSALTLDASERAALAERLLASIDELGEDEAERVWAEEAERRLETVRRGRARTFPADEVHGDAKRLLE